MFCCTTDPAHLSWIWFVMGSRMNDSVLGSRREPVLVVRHWAVSVTDPLLEVPKRV